MNRIGSIAFAGALACALWVAACGGDDEQETYPCEDCDQGAKTYTCEDFCDKGAACEDPDEFDRAECLRDCEDMKAPQEFLACAMDLSCDPSDEETVECIRAIPPNEACSTGCANLFACMEDVEADDDPFMDAQTCSSLCTWQFPTELQECLASAGENCMAVFVCMLTAEL